MMRHETVLSRYFTGMRPCVLAIQNGTYAAMLPRRQQVLNDGTSYAVGWLPIIRCGGNLRQIIPRYQIASISPRALISPCAR